MIMKSWCGLVVFVAGLTILGCQNYSFEELPSSVIKEKIWSQTITIASEIDILFVIDNSGSMAGEQLQLGRSFGVFTSELEKYFGDKYRLAVITTGIECPSCRPCGGNIISGCINETGEAGRFQDRICHNDGSIEIPDYTCTTDPACGKVLLQSTKDCFFDLDTQSGFALTGVIGCGYERGLSAIINALKELSGSWNSGFLRPNATLAVVVISDEDDCGEVGDITEGRDYGAGYACYYASKGVGGDGSSTDLDGKPYKLKPVEDYKNELLAIKNNRDGMVKFAAIVGVKDINDLSTTTIEYYKEDSLWKVEHACTTPDCTGKFCFAEPGIRYIEMAQAFGLEKDEDGFVDTICQSDFSDTLRKVATFVACPRIFLLSEKILDPDLANILINGEPVPRYSCEFTDEVRLVECTGPSDSPCPGGVPCVLTWEYHDPIETPDLDAPGGTITFATHYDPCQFFEDGDVVHIELIYVTP